MSRDTTTCVRCKGSGYDPDPKGPVCPVDGLPDLACEECGGFGAIEGTDEEQEALDRWLDRTL